MNSDATGKGFNFQPNDDIGRDAASARGAVESMVNSLEGMEPAGGVVEINLFPVISSDGSRDIAIDGPARFHRQVFGLIDNDKRDPIIGGADNIPVRASAYLARVLGVLPVELHSDHCTVGYLPNVRAVDDPLIRDAPTVRLLNRT